MRNRKSLSPLKLLGLLLAGQVLVGLVLFWVFGSVIRGWLQDSVDSAVPEDVLTRSEASELWTAAKAADEEWVAVRADLESIRERVAASPEDAVAQLDLLAGRNRLTLLADTAIASGDRKAFDQLVALAGDEGSDQRLRDGTSAEISRVKTFYGSMTRLGVEALPVATLYPSLKSDEEEALSTRQLVLLLGDQEKAWRVRMRAAYLLGSRKGVGVAEVLVEAAKGDPNLDVVRERIVSFEENTGFRSQGMFEVGEMVEWWQGYQSRVSSATGEAPDPS